MKGNNFIDLKFFRTLERRSERKTILVNVKLASMRGKGQQKDLKGAKALDHLCEQEDSMDLQ